MGRHVDVDGDGVADFAQTHSVAAHAATSGLTGVVIRTALTSVGAGDRLIRPLDELAAGAADALRQAPAGLTAAGAAAFLATCAQESWYFRTTTELGSNSYLRGKAYYPYVGRGFVQCTWASNYRLFGQWCSGRGLVSDPEVFVKTPTALADYRWAWLTAVWYFAANGLWTYANRGDMWSVSQGVNRGLGAIGTTKTPNGWTERKKMFDAFAQAGPALLPTQEDDMPSVPEVWAQPIEDLYTPQGGDAMPAFGALAWATAHAAHARDAAADAQATALRVEQKLDQIIAVLSQQR